MTDTRALADLEKRERADAAVALSYAWSFARASDIVVPKLTEAIRTAPGVRVLYLCYRHGNVSASLVGGGVSMTRLDFSPAMLDVARNAVPEACFVEGDAMDLPFEHAAFDAVTIGFGMPHIPEPPKALREVRRVPSKIGRIAFSFWCRPEAGGRVRICLWADRHAWRSVDPPATWTGRRRLHGPGADLPGASGGRFRGVPVRNRRLTVAGRRSGGAL